MALLKVAPQAFPEWVCRCAHWKDWYWATDAVLHYGHFSQAVVTVMSGSAPESASLKDGIHAWVDMDKARSVLSGGPGGEPNVKKVGPVFCLESETESAGPVPTIASLIRTELYFLVCGCLPLPRLHSSHSSQFDVFLDSLWLNPILMQ